MATETPASPPLETSSEIPASVDFNFSESEVFEEAPAKQEVPETPPVAAPASVAPAPQAEAASPPATTPPVEPPAAVESPTPTPTPTSPPTEEFTPERLRELRTTTVDEIAKSFTFSDDEAAQLMTEPEKVLPKLAAEVQVRVMEMVHQIMEQFVPARIEQSLAARTVHEQTVKDFVAEWPELDGKLDDPKVRETLTQYRQMFPNATKEQIFKEGGLLVMARLGLVRQPTAQQTPITQQTIQQRPLGPLPSAPSFIGNSTPAPGSDIFAFDT